MHQPVDFDPLKLIASPYKIIECDISHKYITYIQNLKEIDATYTQCIYPVELRKITLQVAFVPYFSPCLSASCVAEAPGFCIFSQILKSPRPSHIISPQFSLE
jgi:hypothetical protein